MGLQVRQLFLQLDVLTWGEAVEPGCRDAVIVGKVNTMVRGASGRESGR